MTEEVDWKKRYTESKIDGELKDAAIENQAYNPDVFVKMIRGRGTMDDDGQVKVDGIPVREAVKAMVTQEQHANLFLARDDSSPTIDLASLSYEEYKKLRKENPGFLKQF